jgi:hypothetical protein
LQQTITASENSLMILLQIFGDSLPESYGAK